MAKLRRNEQGRRFSRVEWAQLGQGGVQTANYCWWCMHCATRAELCHGVGELYWAMEPAVGPRAAVGGLAGAG
jgi:hypothetical protein